MDRMATTTSRGRRTMDLYGTLRYRGKKIYLNRKKLLENGDWNWVQDSTGLDKADDENATKLLAARNARELAKYELRAIDAQSSGGSLSPVETLRILPKHCVDALQPQRLTS